MISREHRFCSSSGRKCIFESVPVHERFRRSGGNVVYAKSFSRASFPSFRRPAAIRTGCYSIGHKAIPKNDKLFLYHCFANYFRHVDSIVSEERRRVGEKMEIFFFYVAGKTIGGINI